MTMLQRSISVSRESLIFALQGLKMWTRCQVAVAAMATIAVALLIGIATVLIPNPLFARDIPPVWWNYPVWILTSIFSGMLLATYVRMPGNASADEPEDDARSSRLGIAGGILAWFAVGCPVCNKLALIALGYAGAITWFAPLQPFLAIAAMLLSGIALVGRLRGQVICSAPPSKRLAQPEPVAADENGQHG